MVSILKRQKGLMPEWKHPFLSARISERQGWCYSNRPVIKASISSQSHTWTHISVLQNTPTDIHTDTHTHTKWKHKNALFLLPIFRPSRVCVSVRVRARVGGGVKIILNYTFVTWIACCLLCLSSSSLINSAILTFQLLIRHKTSTRRRLFICAFPHFMFLPQRCLFGPRQFRLFICVSWCTLARFSSHRGSFFFFPWGAVIWQRTWAVSVG